MTKNIIKIAIIQMNATVGAVYENGQKIINVMRDLSSSDIDIIIFPEMALTGYPLQDLAWNTTLHKRIKQMIGNICDASRDYQQAVIFGTAYGEKKHPYPASAIADNGGGYHIINSICVIDYGRLIAQIGKIDLPIGEVFDEPRNFIPDAMKPPVMIRQTKIGVVNCHDLWSDALTACYKDCEADLIISLNASPFDMTKYQSRIEIIHNRIDEINIPIIYNNLVGGQDELVFDGTSLVIDQRKKLITRQAQFEESIVVVAFDNITKDIHYYNHAYHDTQSQPMIAISPQAIMPLLSYELMMYRAMVLGLRDYVLKSGFSKVMLGLSGGVDSALVATIACDALGAENVHAYMLPSRFTSQESLDDAEKLAKNLHMILQTINIMPMVDAAATEIEKTKGIMPNGVAYENLQSRCRGTLLMTLSNQYNALLITTGNKSEMAVGYATLYGDMCGAYNPIKNLYKTDVTKICQWYNQHHQQEIIPDNIIHKAPSAELRDNQKDQDSLPDYDILDAILKIYIEKRGHADDAIAAGYDKNISEKIYQLLIYSEYKRAQSAPGVRINHSDFGLDWRYPIQNKIIKDKIS